MRTMIQNKLYGGALAAAVVFAAGCGESNRPVYPSYDSSLLELAKADSSLSTWVELVAIAELDPAFDTTRSTITVLAPNNAAWSALPGDTLAMLRADPDRLAEVILYNATGGSIPRSLLGTYDEIRTLTSTTIAVRGSGDSITFKNSLGTSNYVGGNTYASNGVLHITDAVLIPPTPPTPPLPLILDAAEEAGFTALIAAVDSAGFASALAEDGPFTVLAPTDAAFDAVDLSQVDDEVLANILLTHILDGSFDAAALLAETEVENLANTSLPVDASAMTVGGAALNGDLADIPASNGTIQGIDSVIIPPTILEVVAATDSLSSLDTALGRTSTAAAVIDPDTLMGDAPVTVFAPNNAAFTAAGIDPATVGTSTLAAVINHHIVRGQATSGQFTDGQTLTTLNGTITVNVAGDGTVTITDGAGNTAEVIMGDVRTLSGVVHVIDAVLMPQ